MPGARNGLVWIGVPGARNGLVWIGVPEHTSDWYGSGCWGTQWFGMDGALAQLI